MSKSRKVSVLLPVFNGEKYLPSALDSLLAQTYEDFEVLLSDNCSTDRTTEIAQEYCSRDSRITYFRTNFNIGFLKNFNLCIEKSTGEYIELFSHDDIFKPTCLERLTECLDNHPKVVVATSATNFIDGQGKVISIKRPFEKAGIYLGKTIIRDSLESFENKLVSPVMFRSEHKGSGFDPSLRLYADLDYWLGILKEGDLEFVDEVLFDYRKHEGAQTTKLLEQLSFVPDLVRMVDRYSEYVEDSSDQENATTQHLIDNVLRYMSNLSNRPQYNFEAISGTRDHDSLNSELWSNDIAEIEHPDNLSPLLNDIHDFRRITYLLLEHALVQARFYRELNQENLDLVHKIELLSGDIAALHSSTSWKITEPLRVALNRFRQDEST